MADGRTTIPLPVQREVRQRCGFGCVICGLPLYQYDHMLGWAETKRHVADEITLLCDMHHREKTAGLLSQETIAAANNAPFNLRTGVSKPYDLHYSGTSCEAIIGGNSFTIQDEGYNTAMASIVVDGVPLLGFVLGDGHLLLHVNLFNEFNELVLRIANNELVYSTSAWDIRLVGRRLEIREDQGEFLIEISFEIPNIVRVTRGRFLYNGVEIVVDPQYVLLTNTYMLTADVSMSNFNAAIVVGPHGAERSCAVHIAHVPRGYSPEKRAQAIAWAEESLRQTERTSPMSREVEGGDSQSPAGDLQ